MTAASFRNDLMLSLSERASPSVTSCSSDVCLTLDSTVSQVLPHTTGLLLLVATKCCFVHCFALYVDEIISFIEL